MLPEDRFTVAWPIQACWQVSHAIADVHTRALTCLNMLDLIDLPYQMIWSHHAINVILPLDQANVISRMAIV